ncbi:PepSY domain-containing protein, partial [Candidatus Sumerlaeota bacterium]|nr:PepSY domain-containing protein [Candidatus Sumerlaeota bacterium]
MHKLMLWIHRYTGLGIVLFLVPIALTGSIVAFDSELDRLFNPSLMTVPVRDGPMLDAVELRNRAAAMEPRAAFEFFYLKIPAGHSFQIAAWPKVDPATGKPYVMEYDQLFLDPYTGEKLGSRKSANALIPFIFNLHYGMVFGNPGVRFFGWVALVLTVNCFVGFYLTFPPWSLRRAGTETTKSSGRSWWARWKPSWQIKLGGGFYRTNLDTHRAFGLWTWVLLFIFAWSGVALNLPNAYLAVMNRIGLKQHGIGENLTVPEKPLATPALDWRAALEIGRRLAREEGVRRGFTVTGEDFLRIDRYHGVYMLDVNTSKAPPGMKYGDASVFIDANTGELRDFWSYATASAGTGVARWLVMLHRATVFGLPMKIVNCLMGLVTTALCVTGVIIWLKKREAAATARAR